LGQEAEDAFAEVGLTEFLERANWGVFERLYRDAMDRMRRLAEMQAKIYEKTSQQYLRSINEAMSPHFPVPGPEKRVLYQVRDCITSSAESENKLNLLQPLSILQLSDESPGCSQAHVRKGTEEPKLRRSSPRHEPRVRPACPDAIGYLSLCIGSMPSCDTASADTSPTATGMPWVRPIVRNLALKVSGGLAEGESLPKLECRGQGRSCGVSEQDPPLRQVRRSQSHAPPTLAAPPVGRRILLNSAEGLLTIGTLKMPAAPSGISPPAVGEMPPAPPKLAGKLQRPGMLASRSAPALPCGIAPMPRLLMQSVGSVY